MNATVTATRSSLPILELVTVGELEKTLKRGASGGKQSTLYMLAVSELEEIEARVRRGERVEGSDSVLLDVARRAEA